MNKLLVILLFISQITFISATKAPKQDSRGFKKDIYPALKSKLHIDEQFKITEKQIVLLKKQIELYHVDNSFDQIKAFLANVQNPAGAIQTSPAPADTILQEKKARLAGLEAAYAPYRRIQEQRKALLAGKTSFFSAYDLIPHK
jgi:hypothetical protein